jgi:hypothetical protein
MSRVELQFSGVGGSFRRHADQVAVVEQARAQARWCVDQADTSTAMLTFIRRFSMHYGIYRRYPLAPVSAFKNAWRIARA